MMKMMEPNTFLPQELLLGQELFSITPYPKSPILVVKTGTNSKNAAEHTYIF